MAKSKSRKKKIKFPEPDHFIEALPDHCAYAVVNSIPVTFHMASYNHGIIIARIEDPRLELEQERGKYWLQTTATSHILALEKLIEGIVDVLDIFIGVGTGSDAQTRQQYGVLLEYVIKDV